MLLSSEQRVPLELLGTLGLLYLSFPIGDFIRDVSEVLLQGLPFQPILCSLLDKLSVRIAG